MERLLRAAVAVQKLSPFEFWPLTPYEFTLLLEGENDREEKTSTGYYSYLAWHIEGFPGTEKTAKATKFAKAA